jgi:hypothetical protein
MSAPAQHTPGPWSVHPHFPEHVVPAAHCERKIGGAADDAVDLRDYAQEVCTLGLSRRHKTLAEVDANARLIAAAPELLAVLQDIVRESDKLSERQFVWAVKVLSEATGAA